MDDPVCLPSLAVKLSLFESLYETLCPFDFDSPELVPCCSPLVSEVPDESPAVSLVPFDVPLVLLVPDEYPAVSLVPFDVPLVLLVPDDSPAFSLVPRLVLLLVELLPLPCEFPLFLLSEVPLEELVPLVVPSE